MRLERLGTGIRYQVLADAKEVAREAAARILVAAREAIAARGYFRLVLAGGTTPHATYRRLATANAEWQHWHIYFGDERCLPAEDSGRNSHMAFEAWLDHVPIPRAQIHPIETERGAENAAGDYHTVIAAALPFDLVLLGMGEDGHTASLFPGQRHGPQRCAVAVHHAPKPPAERVSLTASALSNNRALLLLITGAEKHEALQRWIDGEPLPVAQITSEGRREMLLDRAAAGE